MRQFKFRVWSKEENSYLQNYDGDNFFDYDGKLLDLGWFIKCAEDPEDGRFIVEQWTGLVDSEGKDIYEGDIVECLNHKVIDKYRVGYDETYGEYALYYEGQDAVMMIYNSLYVESCKIVGNINQK